MAYAHLQRIEHEPTRAAMRDVMKDVHTLKAQAAAIGVVTEPLTQPLNGNGHLLQHLADAVDGTDAVHLTRLRQEIAGALQAFAKAKGL